MAITVKDFATGRKTFFITPEVSCFPEHFLEDYFALGYECYFIQHTKTVPLRTLIELIISIFHDVILFFNIDSQIDGINWPTFIGELQEKYKDKVGIGVTFTKRPDKDVKVRLEKLYLYDIGITCGCVQLEYQKNANFWIIQKILYANQAQGRRKNIRALCTKAYTFAFMWDDRNYNGTLQDISLSHFSFIFPKDALKIELYEKINEINFYLKGLLLRCSAVLMMQRPVNETDVLNVFAFVDDTGQNGLSVRYKQLITPNIYQLMSSNCKNLLENMIRTKVEKAELPVDFENTEINL